MLVNIYIYIFKLRMFISIHFDNHHGFSITQVLGGSLVAMIGTSIACQSIPYEPGFNAKHLMWIGMLSLI